MKKLLIGFAALFVVLIIAVVVVPFVVPVDTYKSQIVTQTKAATGRDLKIDGEFRLSVFPNLGFVAGKVSLANAPGGKAPHLLSLDALTVRVAFLPLLSGNIEIETFVLDRPQFSLEIDQSGTPNWQFATTTPAGSAATTPPQSATKAEGASTDLNGVLGGLKLGDVRLVGGKVSYSDARTNVRHLVDDINLQVALPSFDRPVRLDGSLIWNNEKISLAVALETPNSLLAAKPTKVDAKVTSAPVNFTFKGSATNGKTIQARGGVDLSVPSVRKLASWAGSPLNAPGSGFGPLKITGEFDMNGNRMSFRNAKLGFDDIKGSGNLAFDSGGKKPSVTANLQLGTLELNPYLPPQQKATTNSRDGVGSAPATSAPAPTPAGWSDEAIDLSALNSMDAKLDLAVEGIQVRKIKIGQSNLNVMLRSGALVADLAKMALYDGVGKAKVTLDGSRKIPALALTFDLSKFQALPFLRDAMAMDRVEGTANADLSVTGRGSSQRDIMSSLDGSGKVQFLDGAIRGVNLAAMLRNIKSAFLDPGAKQTQKTDFAELGGTYRIKQGILTNTDLSLKSPFLRVAGAGTVDLPRQSVNYRIEPKIVASTSGQGGNQDAGGLKVPVIVSGPWANLSYKPDLAGAIGNIAKDPSKALDAVKKLIPGQSGSSSGTSPSLPKPADALKNLFGR